MKVDVSRTPGERCAVCGAAIELGQATYETRTPFDPAPPRGRACSERCAERARRDGTLRGYMAIDLTKRFPGR